VKRNLAQKIMFKSSQIIKLYSFVRLLKAVVNRFDQINLVQDKSIISVIYLRSIWMNSEISMVTCVCSVDRLVLSLK